MSAPMRWPERPIRHLRRHLLLGTLAFGGGLILNTSAVALEHLALNLGDEKMS